MSTVSHAAARPTFSVVIPCRNEESNVVQIAAAVIEEMERVGEPFDILFIDNASDDRTVALVRELCAADPRIRLIVNTRNFGQMRSPTHAVYETRGDAVIGLCADFQDPPTLIGSLIERWRAGADIVLGVRESERSSALLRQARRIAYSLARAFGDYPIIPHATGFGLYDRKVIEALKQLREPEPFWRGMLVETGYRIETIAYARPTRARGRSNNDFFALLDFALSGLSGSSKKLVRVPFYAGVFAAVGCAVALLIAVVLLAVGGNAWIWAQLALFEFHFALLFMFLGLIGDQVRLISERTRRTPLVIERERINFSQSD